MKNVPPYYLTKVILTYFYLLYHGLSCSQNNFTYHNKDSVKEYIYHLEGNKGVGFSKTCFWDKRGYFRMDLSFGKDVASAAKRYRKLESRIGEYPEYYIETDFIIMRLPDSVLSLNFSKMSQKQDVFYNKEEALAAKRWFFTEGCEACRNNPNNLYLKTVLDEKEIYCMFAFPDYEQKCIYRSPPLIATVIAKRIGETTYQYDFLEDRIGLADFGEKKYHIIYDIRKGIIEWVFFIRHSKKRMRDYRFVLSEIHRIK